MNRKLTVFVSVFLVIITGCSSKRHMVCSSTSIVKSSIIKSTYDITYKDNIVYKVIKQEVITNKNTDTLYELRDSIELSNREYNMLSHYKNYVEINDDTLVSVTKINYNRLDLNKYIKIDKSNKSFISSNKVVLNKLVKYYNSLGLSCEKVK